MAALCPAHRPLTPIEPGDQHKIKNAGHDLLTTLNIYIPPGYDRDGEPLPHAQP